MAVSRAMWEKGIQMDAAQMRRNALADRIEKTKAITAKWNVGFRALKEENDRLQLEAATAYKVEIARIAASVKQWMTEGPPKD